MSLRAFILETRYLMALGSASPAVFVIDSVSSKQDLFPFFLSSGLQAGTGKLESIPTQPKGCLQCLKLKTKCFACKLRCHFSLSKISLSLSLSLSLSFLYPWVAWWKSWWWFDGYGKWVHAWEGMKYRYGDAMHAWGFMYMRNNWNEMKVG